MYCLSLPGVSSFFNSEKPVALIIYNGIIICVLLYHIATLNSTRGIEKYLEFEFVEDDAAKCINANKS